MHNKRKTSFHRRSALRLRNEPRFTARNKNGEFKGPFCFSTTPSISALKKSEDIFLFMKRN